MNSQVWWFTARAGGIVAWSVVAASVIWGLALSTKMSRSVPVLPRPNWMLDLHRYLGGLGVIFTVVHVSALVADSYVHFGPVQLLVPFTGAWHPIAVGWGIIAAYFLLAVELTSLARRRLPKRLWKLTHFASFPLFGLATVHGLTAGTDGTGPALRIAMAITVLVVGVLTSLRIFQAQGSAPGTTPARRSTPPQPSAPARQSAPVVPLATTTTPPNRPCVAAAPSGAFFVPAPRGHQPTRRPRAEGSVRPPFDFESLSNQEKASTS
jgi:DMSO/TMAO reductase YedYZ heme-binding membrane subunit